MYILREESLSLSLKIFIVILITTVLNSGIGVNISLGENFERYARYSLTLSCNIEYLKLTNYSYASVLLLVRRMLPNITCRICYATYAESYEHHVDFADCSQIENLFAILVSKGEPY